MSLPDVSFVQNSLTELTESTIDTETLIANSCVVPSGGQRGTFIITGAGGLPVRPGDASVLTNQSVEASTWAVTSVSP